MANADKIQKIPGNAPVETKERVRYWLDSFASNGFATRVVRYLNLVDVSIIPSVNEPLKEEARVVLETIINEDMVNPRGIMHGGCIAYLVDICTTLPIVAFSLVTGGAGYPGVSQSINIIYHAPANLGDELRLINTSTAMSTRQWTARAEIWDVTHHRLVASATQIKMKPSAPKM